MARTSSADAETISLVHLAGSEGSPVAVHLTGPNGGTRQLLTPGEVVQIGRGAENAIFIDDPRVSRSHAAVRALIPFAVTDLGSANGTFVGRERLQPGAARALAAGEIFFVGDSALALRPSGLQAPSNGQVIELDQLSGRVARMAAAASPPNEGGMVVLKVRPSKPGDGKWVASILRELLTGPDDWTLLDGAQTILGLAAASRATAAVQERDALVRLGSWSIAAAVDSVFVPAAGAQDAERAAEAVLAFLRGSGVVSLQRGVVIIRDPAMESLRLTLQRIAPAPVTLLVLGETGVGKDVVASMVHELSPRAAGPFVRLNCATLPEPLLENELFGHERGAFTGALGTKIGLLEAADGGTVFFDEIGDLALSLQAKLLHVVESSELTRLGGVRARRIDVRFVSATNRPLDDDVRNGRFRTDLYHRLAGVVVKVPPLRQRPSEIEPLARHFLARACERFALSDAELSPAAVDVLLAYEWPGNVRELRNVVERAVLLAGEKVLQPHHLGLAVVAGASSAGPAAVAPADASSQGGRTVTNAGDLDPSVSAASAETASERASIEEALTRCGGNQSRAAELLGIPRRTLVRRIAQLRLPRPRRPPP